MRTAGATAILVGGFLLAAGAILAPTSAARAAERQNCPAGFTWIRMSGIGCVQESLPAHAKITDVGYSVCIEPYVGIYEDRFTTDGRPAPGTPYTRFAYLKECLTRQEFERRKQGGEPGLVGDAARRLYGGGSQPSAGRLAVTAALLAGAAALAGRGWIRGGWGAGSQALTPRLRELAEKLAKLDREIAAALSELDPARAAVEEKEAAWKKAQEVLRQIEQLHDRVRTRLRGIELGLWNWWGSGALLDAASVLFAVGGFGVQAPKKGLAMAFVTAYGDSASEAFWGWRGRTTPQDLRDLRRGYEVLLKNLEGTKQGPSRKLGLLELARAEVRKTWGALGEARGKVGEIEQRIYDLRQEREYANSMYESEKTYQQTMSRY